MPVRAARIDPRSSRRWPVTDPVDELEAADDLWRRRQWHRRPPEPPTRWGPEGAAALSVVYSYVVNRVVPSSWYVPANITAATAFVAVARGLGATWTDLGLRKERLGRGVRVGLAAAVPIAAVVAAGVAVPATRKYFADQRVIGIGAGATAFDVLVRIPIGTALCEELIFRGAMLGVLLRHRTPIAAVMLSSLMFGLWHVFPTLDTLHLNPVGSLVEGSALRTTEAVVGAVAVTGAAGAGFAWLRLRANSTVAPIIAHGVLNAAAFLGGRLVASTLH
jgi:membrane protease YdiL (CAAX protease family)